jgi:UDP-glucose 4-epimerase
VNILVAGGAGYIGSATCHALVEAGHRVTVVDDLSAGHRDALPAEVELFLGNTGEPDSIGGVLARGDFEAVIDFAAFIEAGESMKVPERYFRNNAANALSLLEAMIVFGVPKFVFSSSAAVYGDPETIPVREESRLEPTNPYGVSKLQVEQMLRWLNVAHGIRFASLRYFNAAGAIAPNVGESHRPESHLIPLVLGCALGQRDFVSIHGDDYPTPDGSCVRDYVHVIDVAAAHVLALEALSDRDQVTYNIGNGVGFSVKEVINVARRVTGCAIPALERKRRAGDPAVLIASSEAIKTELGWMPRYPVLEEIVASAWEWHVQHPDGFHR